MANAAYNIPDDAMWLYAPMVRSAGNALKSGVGAVRRRAGEAFEAQVGGGGSGAPADAQRILESLRHFSQFVTTKRRLVGKHARGEGPGRPYLQNHDDTDHVDMSYMDVESWMSTTQNKDDLIQNLFKRPNFKQWLHKTYGSVDETRVYHALREFSVEDLASMLVILDRHS
jgi:hypothetical protein